MAAAEAVPGQRQWLFPRACVTRWKPQGDSGQAVESIYLPWPRPGTLEKKKSPPSPAPPPALPAAAAPLPQLGLRILTTFIHSQSPTASSRKGEASRPRGWRCWPWASPACLPTTPSPNAPTLACPFSMAGKVLIPSAERWARGCGQERRDCLQPLAALGSSGPAGWPRGDMFILQAPLLAPAPGRARRRVLGAGDGLAAGGCLRL